MSCTTCGSGYGILKKEVGCEVCGFSFCNKCCSKKTLPKGTSKQYVCKQCYGNLTNDKSSAGVTYSPPLAHKKRMAQMTNRSMSVGSSTSNDEKDKEIAERLQKLKRERNKEIHPSQTEIEERLAKLKGMDPAKYTAPPIMVYRPADKRTSIEQASDLMQQIVEEVQLDDKQVKPEVEIAMRLAKLRGEPPPQQTGREKINPNEFAGVSSSHDDADAMDIDEECRKFASDIINLEEKAYKEICGLKQNKDYQQALENMKHRKEGKEMDSDEDIDEDAEAEKIIQKLSAVGLESSEMEDSESSSEQKINQDKTENENDDDEFPWCVICTEDAKIRCFGCDSDLYCMNCFRECHDSLDIRDHKSCPFLSPKKKTLG